MTSILRRAWHRHWFGHPTSVDNLGYVRMAIGVGLLALHLSNFISLLSVDLSGPLFYFLEPIWYFRMLGIHHAYPILNVVVFAVLMASTISLIIGYRTRTAIVIVLLCVFYLKGVRDSAAGDVHHRYLMWVHALIFLMASRAREVRSLDRRRLERRGKLRPIEAWETSWPLRAMQSYVALFYCGSAIAKLRVAGGDWFFDGTAAQQTLLVKSARWSFETLSLGFDLAHFPTLAWLLVMSTICVELFFPALLFLRTIPRALFLSGITVFHIANGLLLGVNFYVTPVLFAVFFDLGKWRRFGSR